MAFQVREIPDLFPELQQQQQPVATPLGPLLHPQSKDYFLQLPDVTCFTFKLSDGEMKFYRSYHGDDDDEGCMPMAWKHEILQDNFVRTALESTRMQGEFRPDKIHFERLQERYQKSLKLRGRHNTDVRAGYCWDHRQQFLVKAYFTFGQRTVPKGQVHIYRTTAAPMLFYKLDPTKYHVRKFRVRDKWFHKDDQWVYDQYVLQPNSIYAVPENTTYAVLTVQKTFFSLHVLVVADAAAGELNVLKPDSDRTLTRNVHDDDDDGKGYVARKRRKLEEDPCKKPQRPPTTDLSEFLLNDDNEMPAPTYPPGTCLETMLMIEQLKLQIKTLTERLAKYENV